VRNKFLVNFRNRTILLCVPCIFIFLIRLFNSSFVFMLHVLSVSIAGPSILIYVFPSVINDFRSTNPFSTHGAPVHAITCLTRITIQRDFNLAFFDGVTVVRRRCKVT